MRTIIVGFSKSKKRFAIGSWLIRLYQLTKFSHTYIRLPVGDRWPSDKIIQASDGLVNHMSFTQFEKRAEIIEEFEIEVTDEEYHNLTRNYLHELAGARYGFKQNIGIVFVHIAKLLGYKNCKNPWPQGFNCSEFVVHCLKSKLPKYFGHLDPDTVTPKEVFLALVKRKEDNA
jgi:hypothetical protein